MLAPLFILGDMTLAVILVLAQISSTSIGAEELGQFSRSKQADLEISGLVKDSARVSAPWKSAVVFRDLRFEQPVSFAGFESNAWFITVEFESVRFTGEFGGETNFFYSKFHEPAKFMDVHFRGPFSCGATIFEKPPSFARVEFHDKADFNFTNRTESPIVTQLEFDHTRAHREIAFNGRSIWDLRFASSTFNGPLVLIDAELRNFRSHQSWFDVEPVLNGTQFIGEMSFAGTTFKEGLDLRFADLSKATSISFEKIRSNPAEFFVDWSQIQRRGKHRLDVERGPEEKPDKWFPRLAAMYQIVANAYNAQHNGADAERALNELEVRRQETFGGFWHGAYGVLLGFGFQPWRVIFLVIPLILIFVALYVPYREVIASILDADIKKGTTTQDQVTGVARGFHLLFFSSAVLLGIRFKSEWIQPSNTPFMVLVAIEWIFGIVLYVTFFALVKTSGFTYVKGLLGF
jgi:hypothetical protein